MSRFALNALRDKTNFLLIYFPRKEVRANQAWDIILLCWLYAAVISEHTEVQELQWEQSSPSRWGGLIYESVLMEPLQQEAGTDLCTYLTLSHEQKMSLHIFAGFRPIAHFVFVAQEKCSSVAFCAISHKSRMWKYLKGERNCSNCNYFANILLAKPNLQSSKLLFQSVGFVKHATEGYPAKILSKMHSTPMLIMTDQTFQVCDLHALNRFWAEQELPLATLWLIHAYLGI